MNARLKANTTDLPKQIHYGHVADMIIMHDYDHPEKGDDPYWLEAYGKEISDPETHSKRHNGTKPYYDVLWTSSRCTEGPFVSDWARALYEDEPELLGKRRIFELTPSPTARIFTINTAEDIVALQTKYPVNDFDVMDCKLQVDWSLVADDFDAIHVTAHAAEQFDYVLEDWDCESTAWFHEAWTGFRDITASVTPPTRDQIEYHWAHIRAPVFQKILQERHKRHVPVWDSVDLSVWVDAGAIDERTARMVANMHISVPELF